MVNIGKIVAKRVFHPRIIRIRAMNSPMAARINGKFGPIPIGSPNSKFP
jgi:hypothetical protein|tara:strand:+ start:463 stop:609 length:147 start_codon:yes stop_codon:yes gene_type:complete